jgi:hypothetical protein
MMQILIVNMDKEQLTLDVNPDELESCLACIEEGKTFHCSSQNTGFFFPKENIRYVAFSEKPIELRKQEEVVENGV